MKTRKTVLLSCIGVLLVICIVQAIVLGRNPVKTIKTDETFDSITIEKSGEKIEFSLENNDWFVGKGNYKANITDINNMTNNLKEIKILDNVARLSSDEANERYDLNEAKAIKVSASKGGNVVREITVGKASSTGAQTYVVIDSSKEINLVSGNLYSVFSKSEDSYRSKTVFEIKGTSVSSVKVSTKSENWSVVKANTEEIAWNLEGDASGKENDSSKVNSWIGQIVNCTASAWADDSKVLPSQKDAEVQIESAEGNITIDIYSEEVDDKTKYFATSNQTSHKFELSESTAKRYIKSYEDLLKS